MTKTFNTALAVMLAGAACSDCSPQTGALVNASACAASTSSTNGYGAYSVATPAPGTCSDGGSDASNTIGADAGVAGDIIVADQLNNRVIVLDRQGGIVWSFGDGSSKPGPTSIVAPNDAEYLPGDRVLTVGTGIPPGGTPSCPNGCNDDRVLLIDVAKKKILWQYTGDDALSAPTSARFISSSSGDQVLVSDQGNGRVVRIDMNSQTIVWRFPMPGDAGAEVISPQSAELLPSGNVFIADQAGSRVIAVSPAGVIGWHYPDYTNVTELDFPASASRLPDTTTLITSYNTGMVIEVDLNGNLVWSYAATSPTGAVRLQNGHTLITQLTEDQVIEVGNAWPPNVVYTHGARGVAGAGMNELNQPYNAKVIGDYTGITDPGPGVTTPP